MQTVARKSPLGWAVVHKIEGTKDFDPDVVDLNEEDVRKVEKELIAYNLYGFEVSIWFWCLASVFYSLSHPEDIALATRVHGTTNRMTGRDSGTSWPTGGLSGGVRAYRKRKHGDLLREISFYFLY